MAYNKKADDNYRKKYKYIGLKYAIHELENYEKIARYCNDNNISMQKYIKELITNDLNKKGV